MDDFWHGLGVAAGIFAGMILHEYAHARAAVAMGDRTPIAFGRLTLHPKAHVDPVGTVIMPILFLIPILLGRGLGMVFGYAKPVPLNPRAMRDQRRAPFLVALAGPVTNFGLALAAGAILRFGSTPIGSPIFFLLVGFLTVNSFLALINALPIPPLDGSRVLGLFLSPQTTYKMEELSQYFLLFLVALFLIFRGVLSALADPVCQAASFALFGGCSL